MKKSNSRAKSWSQVNNRWILFLITIQPIDSSVYRWTCNFFCHCPWPCRKKHLKIIMSSYSTSIRSSWSSRSVSHEWLEWSECSGAEVSWFRIDGSLTIEQLPSMLMLPAPDVKSSILFMLSTKESEDELDAALTSPTDALCFARTLFFQFPSDTLTFSETTDLLNLDPICNNESHKQNGIDREPYRDKTHIYVLGWKSKAI